MAVAPCKGCTDREVGCHSSCSKYQIYRKQQDEENAARTEFLRNNTTVIHKGSFTGDSGLGRGKHKRR